MDCEWEKLSVPLSTEVFKTIKEDLKFTNTTPVQVNYFLIINKTNLYINRERGRKNEC